LRNLILTIFFCAAFAFPAHAESLKLNEVFLSVQAEAAKHPENLDLQMDLAFLFTQGQELGHAIEIYESVLGKDAQNVRATTELCALYTEIHDKTKALTHCERATELTPQNPLVFDNLGLSYFKFGQFRSALKPFLQALALQTKAKNGTAALIRTHIAQTFLALHEYDAAEGYYQKILQEPGLTNEEKSLVYYGLHLALKEKGDYDAAFTAMQETYKLSSNPLFLGKVISSYMLSHQAIFFFVIGGLCLVFANYLGQRLNRFLKNED
jgi:tetratricopeptide (TPR) repeat protein